MKRYICALVPAALFALLLPVIASADTLTPASGTSTSALIHLSGNSGRHTFVVGSGRYHLPVGNTQCEMDFSLNAHMDSTGFHGEQTLSVPNGPGCSGVAGLIKANVACLAVNTTGPAPMAQITGFITQVTGALASGLSVGDELAADVTDNGPPSSGTPDQIDQFALPFGDASHCVALPGDIDLDDGNITIHA